MAAGNQHNDPNRLDRLFREGLEDFQAPPSEGLWDAVSNEAQQNAGETNSRKRDWIYATVALILLMLTSINLSLFLQHSSGLETLYPLNEQNLPFFDLGKKQNKRGILSLKLRKIHNKSLEVQEPATPTEAASNTASADSASSSVKQAFTTIEDQKTSESSHSVREPKNDNTDEQLTSQKMDREESATIERQDREELPLEHIPRASLDLLEREHNIDLAERINKDMGKTKNVDELLRNELLDIQGFHIGLRSTVNSSWVFMDQKQSELNFLGQDINYKFDYGYSYGFTAGYDFSTKYGIQAGMMINSVQGQKFSHRLNGRRVHTEIDMQYMHFPVIFKYKWSKMSGSTNKPIVLNTIVGLQYSRLRSASIHTKHEMLRGESKFPASDLGIVMGLEYDVFLSDNYYLTLGARGSISTEMSKFPSLFSNNNQSDRVLLGVSVSINRLFPTQNQTP